MPRVPPIRVSPDGDRILLGSGDIYDADTFARSGGLPDAFVDAQWLPDGGVVTLRASRGASLLERRTASFALAEVVEYPGAPLAIVSAEPELVVVTDEGRPSFHVY